MKVEKYLDTACRTTLFRTLLWDRNSVELTGPRKTKSLDFSRLFAAEEDLVGPLRTSSGGNGGIRTLDEALHPILP